jgi:predicted nucleotidyltransferase
MRLTPEQIHAIKRHTQAVFGAHAVVRLFGSRTDDSLRGGDVDLLVETPDRVPLAAEIKLAARLEGALGMPVDIITTFPAQKSRPIVKIAKLTGVTL